MREFAGVLLAIWLASPALAVERQPVQLATLSGCLEPGDSDFYYPVGNIIKYCADERDDHTCAQFLCTRCQANGNWTEDYVCSKPERPVNK